MTLSALPLLAWMLACGGSPEQPVDGAPAATQPADGPAVVDPKTYDPVIQALSAVKPQPEPKCSDVDALLPDMVSAYRYVIANVKEPTVVPIRATTCLLQQHPREAEQDALVWVMDPNAGNLTTIVLGRLDRMPLESAKKIAAAALSGPHREDARVRISRLRTPALKQMATEAP